MGECLYCKRRKRDAASAEGKKPYDMGPGERISCLRSLSDQYIYCILYLRLRFEISGVLG